ncbi:MAG: nucleotidyltransferase domain-containing protein [Nitrospirae bacterium]|nr:nucleotidyltransferase domain-containing protein [Nitrospirota bacterium]
MNKLEIQILDTLKRLLIEKVKVYKLILFGSRARGDAGPYSDMDVLVIVDNPSDERDFDYLSDCSCDAGFEYGISK